MPMKMVMPIKIMVHKSAVVKPAMCNRAVTIMKTAWSMDTARYGRGPNASDCTEHQRACRQP